MFGQKWLCCSRLVVFWQKRLYSGQSSCIRGKVVVIGQSGCIRAKVVIFGQKWL